jgi:hypothetical protein
MQDSYSELIKLLLPEIIEYFELTSYKREMKPHLYLKEVNSIPKEYRQSRLSSKDFWWDNSSGFSNPWTSGIPSHIAEWLNEDTGQVVHRDWI